MYRKESEGWFKHTDFILIDMICTEKNLKAGLNTPILS